MSETSQERGGLPVGETAPAPMRTARDRAEQALPRIEDWDAPWGHNKPTRVPSQVERAQESAQS
jgi:hypothetical protein